MIKALDGEGLSVRSAQRRMAIAAADFSRTLNADLGRFTVDRLMSIINRLGSRVEVKIKVGRAKSVEHVLWLASGTVLDISTAARFGEHSPAKICGGFLAGAVSGPVTGLHNFNWVANFSHRICSASIRLMNVTVAWECSISEPSGR